MNIHILHSYDHTDYHGANQTVEIKCVGNGIMIATFVANKKHFLDEMGNSIYKFDNKANYST